jgi:hypothetical protein
MGEHRALHMVDHAWAYAARGWSVFPTPASGEKMGCISAAKSNGNRWGATKNPAEIGVYFKQRFPAANLGIETGSCSGFFVIEADSNKGHGIDGIAALRALVAQHGALPDTLMAESPTGSLHCYFNNAAGLIVRNSASVIAPGVDVRGEGGMIIAPPSVRPGVGRYRWLNAYPIADAPQWLLQKIAEPANGNAKPATPPIVWRELLAAGINAGARDCSIARIAGYLLSRRVDPFVVLKLLQSWNATDCRPPLPQQDIVRIVNSIAGKELKRRQADG